MAEKRTIEVEIKDNSKNLKQQLREAQKEVEKLSELYGATSAEATNAAKKAAELKDAIGDAKALTDAYNPDAKFNALAGSIGGVLDGFQAFEGALGLVGVESEKVQEALLKVNSAMALAQGVNGVLESVESFKILGAQIAKTAIGQKALTALTWMYAGAQKALNAIMNANPIVKIISLIVVATGAVYGFIKAMDFFSDSTENATQANERLTKAIEKQDAANERKNKRMTRDHAHEMAMLEARGATEKQIHDLKMSQIDKELKANENRQQSELKNIKNLYANYKQAIAEDDTEKAKEIGKQIKDREKLYQELNGQHQDYINTKQELNAKYLSEEQKAEEQAAKEKRDKANEKAKADLERLKDFQKEARAVIDASLRDERENEIAAVNEKYKERFILAKKYGKDTTDLTTALNTELNAIETKYAQERLAQDEAEAQRELEILAEKNAKRIELEDAQFELEKEIRAKRITEDPNASNADKLALEIEQLATSYDAKFELALGNAELEKQLEESFQFEKDQIKKKYSDAELERIEKERQARVASMQNNLETAQQSINAIQNLSDTVFAIRLNKAKKGSAEEEKIARKQFQVNKALQIASATMNGIQSILAITATAVDPTGITTAIRIGAQAVLTAASIAKIASTRFESNSGGGSASAPSGGGASGGGGQAPNFNIVGNSTANQLAQVEQKPVQAFVVSGEVTSAQALDRNRQVNATFG